MNAQRFNGLVVPFLVHFHGVQLHDSPHENITGGIYFDVAPNEQ